MYIYIYYIYIYASIYIYLYLYCNVMYNDMSSLGSVGKDCFDILKSIGFGQTFCKFETI